MDEQRELNQYLYDLQGYLVIKDVLSERQVAELNALIDENLPPVPDDWRAAAEKSKFGVYEISRFGMAGGSYESGPGFLAWGKAFRDLIDHPVVMDVMRMQLGDCFRLDRIFGMRMRKGMPSWQLHADACH